MKRTLTGFAAASLLIGLPLAAAAHDDDRGHGRGHSKHYGQSDKRQQARWHYHQAPQVVYRPAPQVVYRPAPPPRVVGYPVYVPAPVAVPAPPRPWPLNQVDIGFRIFF